MIVMLIIYKNLDGFCGALSSKGYNVIVELLFFDLECSFILVVWYHTAKEKGAYNIKAFRHSKYSAVFSKYISIRFTAAILPRDVRNNFSVS